MSFSRDPTDLLLILGGTSGVRATLAQRSSRPFLDSYPIPSYSVS